MGMGGWGVGLLNEQDFIWNFFIHFWYFLLKITFEIKFKTIYAMIYVILTATNPPSSPPSRNLTNLFSKWRINSDFNQHSPKKLAWFREGVLMVLIPVLRSALYNLVFRIIFIKNIKNAKFRWYSSHSDVINDSNTCLIAFIKKTPLTFCSVLY